MIVCEKRYTDHEKSIETKIGPWNLKFSRKTKRAILNIDIIFQ